MLEQIHSDGTPAAGAPVRLSGTDVFERIADALPVLISYVDATRRYRFNNRLYEEWFGHTREDIAGRTMEDVLGPEAYAALRPRIDAALKGELVTFESLVPYRDAGLRHIRASYVPDTVDDVVRGFFVLVEDISERKREEARAAILSEATRQFAASTHDLPQLMTLIASRVAEEIGDVCGISMLEPDGSLALVSMQHRDAERTTLLLQQAAGRAMPSDGLRRVLDGGKPVRLTKEQLAPAIAEESRARAYAGRFGLDAALIVPLRLGETSIGVLGLWREDGGQPYTEAEERLAVELARRAALAIHNARLHDELQARVAQLQTVLDIAPVGIATTLDETGAHISANRTLAAMVGIEPGENASLSGDGGLSDQLRVERDGTPLAPDEMPMQVTARTGQPVPETEYEFVSNDGTLRRPVLGRTMPLLDEFGRPRGAVGAFVDVSSQKATERELRRSGERQRALADALPALVVTTGSDGMIEDFNAAYGEYTGLTIEQARDWENYQIIHPDDYEHAMQVWETALTSGDRMVNEMRLRRHDGEYRWHLVSGMPMRGESGGIERWVTVSVDVHDRKEIERERERWTEALEKANAAKDEFLGLVSHELRTPITTIFGNAQVLRRSSHLMGEQDRASALADIEREAERLQRIIENMLVLARVEGGHEMNIEPVRVAPLIEAVTKEHRHRHPSRTLHVEVAPDLGIAAAERTYLELVLRNLLGNAEKYTPRSGAIWLMANRSGPFISIAVRDECGGLGDGEEEAIFGAFYRSPRSAHLAAGTGIGLAVCRRLVEAQHGTISARSLPGEGCEISFTLPVELPAED